VSREQTLPLCKVGLGVALERPGRSGVPIENQALGRSRYVITERDQPHFLTCTVVEWLPVFTRPEAVQIILDSWSYQRQHEGLKLFGYVILENHLNDAA